MGANLREYLGNFICNVTTDPVFFGYMQPLCKARTCWTESFIIFTHIYTKIEYGRDFRHPTATAVVRAVAL